MLRLLSFALLLRLGVGSAGAADATFIPDIHAEPHAYFQREPNDPFARILKRVGADAPAFDTSSESAFLRSLLAALDIPVSSQLLVFSNTSLQLSLIHPSNPRALYFSDDLYVGWVPGGKIEIASIDPDLGAVFYIFEIPRDGGRIRAERARRCMNCHANEDTFHVPGLSVKSIAPAISGGSLDTFRPEISGHGVPMEQRLGGWHVTGGSDAGHLGNRMGHLENGEVRWTALPPGTRFSWNRYPVATSDLAAHLLHEHHAGGINRMVRAQYRARELRTASPEVRRSALEAEADDLVRYFLFTDEVPLPAGLDRGDPQFRADYVRNRRSVEGVSLKDLDLKTRLFRYRCSPLIHTAQFNGLAPELRESVLKKLSTALKPGIGPAHASHLKEPEKAVIRRILTATVPGSPAG